MPTSRDAIPSEALERLALFPLPNTVFFPNTILPLHIFEPRYRQMTREALAFESPIAVVLARAEGRYDANGRPAVHGVAGLGTVIDHEPLQDGRFNILLHGLGRVRIVRELDSKKPFRQVVAEWVEEVGPTGDLTERMSTLRNSILALHRMHPDIGVPLFKMAHSVDSIGALIDIMASILFPEVQLRQKLLEEGRFDVRYERILERLTDLLIEGVEEPPQGQSN